MRKVIVRNKKFLMFAFFLLIIGIISGVIYYNFLNDTKKQGIIESLSIYNSFNNNYILKDLIIMSILLVSSFFVVGLPFGIFYIFYEGLSWGFSFSVLTSIYSYNGLWFSFLYLLVNKGITLIFIIIFIKRIINISRYIIGYFIYKKDSNIKNKIASNFKRSLYLIIIVFVINIIVYFISPLILNNYIL